MGNDCTFPLSMQKLCLVVGVVGHEKLPETCESITYIAMVQSLSKLLSQNKKQFA